MNKMLTALMIAGCATVFCSVLPADAKLSANGLAPMPVNERLSANGLVPMHVNERLSANGLRPAGLDLSRIGQKALGR